MTAPSCKSSPALRVVATNAEDNFVNASKAIPELSGPTARCVSCGAQCPLGPDGHCPSCFALAQLSEIRSKQKLYDPDTKIGSCPKCGSKNLQEIPIGFKPSGSAMLLSTLAIIALLLFQPVFAIPLMGILVVTLYVAGPVKTLRTIERKCLFCCNRWEPL